MGSPGCVYDGGKVYGRLVGSFDCGNGSKLWVYPGVCMIGERFMGGWQEGVKGKSEEV